MPLTDMPPGYWADYEDDIRDILTENVVRATEESIMESLRLAGADLDGVSDELLARIQNNIGELTAKQADRAAKQIREVTQTAVQEKINDWYESGDRTVDQLAESLSPYFGDARARRIATTETTRSYADQNIAVWKELGYVSGKRWQTARDDLVCPICRPQHGDFYPLDSTGFTGLGSIGIGGPPAHVNCFLAGTDILAGGEVTALMKRFFQGQIVTVTTAENELSVTFNHPILTRRGWIPAGKLEQGMDVFSYSPDQWESAIVSVNKQNGITQVQDVFSSIQFPRFGMPTPSPYFDYDGRNPNIAVIRPYGIVDGMNQPLIHKPFRQHSFIMGNIEQSPFPSYSPSTKFFQRNTPTPDGLMGGLSLANSLVRGHVLPFNFFGFGLTPNTNPGFNKAGLYGPAANPERFGQLVYTIPGQILVSEVVNVKIDSFSGHVYNLQTDSGIVFSNNVITHNCRCWLKPVYEDI